MSQERETVVTVVTKGIGQRRESEGTACLVVFYGQNIGRRYFLEKDSTLIGRSDVSDVQVDQESVSRQHARIEDPKQPTVVDLGSTNGTFVNDRQVEKTELRDGDLVRIGQTIFKYLSGGNIESKYHEEIYRLTTIDGLTEAYNRRYFLEAFERELNRSLRYERVLSLALFDIDRFKRINDEFGHLAGDYVLRKLAALVTQNIRREDVFARYGGEEFALLFPEIAIEDAAQVCEKLREIVENFAFEYDQQRIPVTMSFGIRATRPGESSVTSESFLADADAKLYEAKENGRNRVCY